MKKIGKWLSLLLSFTTVSTLACACGGGGAGNANDEPQNIDINLPEDYTAELDFGISAAASESLIANVLVNGFNEYYPNIKINIYPLTTSVATNVLAGTMCDIVFSNFDKSLQEYKYIMNLDKYIEAENIDMSQYYEVVMDYYKINNSQYALARDYNKIVVVYNKEIFEDLGVAVPTDGWSYKEFVEKCAELKAAMAGRDSYKAVYPCDAMINWDPVFNAFALGFGTELLDTETGEVKFNCEEGSNAFKAMQSLVDNGYTIDPEKKGIDIFPNGNSAMWFMSRASMTNIDYNLGTGNYDFVTFPAFGPKQGETYTAAEEALYGKTPVIGAGSSCYWMYSGTEDPNACWAFLRYIISEEGQEALSATGNLVPVIKSMAEDEDATWKTKPSATINHDAFIKYPERDRVSDYIDGVPYAAQAVVNAKIIELIYKYTRHDYNNSKYATDMDLLADYKALIEGIINDALLGL